MVNPRACYESEIEAKPLEKKKHLAVVGAGMAGMSFALEAAKRGHDVEIFEKNAYVGGQFNLASRVPGKEDFKDSIHYFQRMLEKFTDGCISISDQDSNFLRRFRSRGRERISYSRCELDILLAHFHDRLSLILSVHKFGFVVS